MQLFQKCFMVKIMIRINLYLRQDQLERLDGFVGSKYTRSYLIREAVDRLMEAEPFMSLEEKFSLQNYRKERNNG
jgi:metal-responsive CopG/Arc/MetJ family transcriptional regulator